MQKIEGIKITDITTSGFRCFAETTGFRCGDMTIISGANGQGKSSIADAIAYAFCGTGFFGEKSTERLQNPQCDLMEVLVSFADEYGELHKLYRGRKNGKAATITLDNVPITQTTLSEMIGDKDLFLSILNPLYFVEVLGTKGRALLEQHMPCLPQEDILLALPEGMVALLPQEGLLSPETYIKNCRAELRELERDLVYTEGKLDYAVSCSEKCVMLFNQNNPAMVALAMKFIEEAIFQNKGISLDSIKEAIDDKKRRISAAQAYSEKKYELLFQGLQTEPNGQQLASNRVTLSLSEVMSSTGEVKDDFSFLYEGRPYNTLSLSEKVRAGIAITELIKRMTGRNYPVFIDNAESICVFDNVRPTGQTFFSRVVKGQALQVDCREMPGTNQQTTNISREAA